MTTAFWILVGLSFLGVFAVLKFGITSGPHGGAVGAWLAVIPLFFLLGLGLVMQVSSSVALRAICLSVAGFIFLAVASVSFQLLVVEPMKEWQDDKWRARVRSGVDTFPEPAQLALLRAVAEKDVEKVKALLPAAGDLNKLYGNTTLFLFALQLEDNVAREADVAILEAMLKAGANPNIPAGRPLLAGYKRGTEVLKLMLEAGADVNYEVYPGEPGWWGWFQGDWPIDSVKLALAHGADLQARKDGVGAVARAASGNNWELVVMLIEAGAPYKGEPAGKKGMTLYEFVKAEVDTRVRYDMGPDAALAKTMALLEAGAR